MSWIYQVARFWPIVAISMLLVLWELQIYFKRQKKPMYQGFMFVLMGVFLLSAIVWIALRGDLNSDSWVRSIEDYLVSVF